MHVPLEMLGILISSIVSDIRQMQIFHRWFYNKQWIEVIKLVWPFIISLLPIRWEWFNEYKRFFHNYPVPRQECGSWMLKIFHNKCFIFDFEILPRVFFSIIATLIYAIRFASCGASCFFSFFSPIFWHTTYITNRASKHKLVSHTDFKMQRVKEMWP